MSPCIPTYPSAYIYPESTIYGPESIVYDPESTVYGPGSNI